MFFIMKTRIFILGVALFLNSVCTRAQQSSLSGPPYLAHSSNFIMTLFNLRAEDVQPLLPSSVKAKIKDAGMVTAGLEIYETDRIHGIPQYSMVFLFVEVAGLESNNGTPGHWAIWGRINQKSTLQNMLHHFSFPYGFEEIKLTHESNVYTGTVGAGLIDLKIKFNEKQPFAGEGIVNMCSFSRDGKILITEVPWFSTGSTGELVRFDIDPQGDKVLEIVKNAKPYFSMISTNQTFSYSRPISK
jgi:hypothetical protein